MSEIDNHMPFQNHKNANMHLIEYLFIFMYAYFAVEVPVFHNKLKAGKKRSTIY